MLYKIAICDDELNQIKIVSDYLTRFSIKTDTEFQMERFLRILWLYILFKMAVHITENLAAGTSFLKPVDFFFEGVLVKGVVQ